eukprot:TRINITY_DN41578_c0_g1_i1.p3 TRINITY_DN41578_c0_g1~~TRINITY_DN41578_c0_g1_i1.p3  ORF type:complete len:102 (+),score=1.36 TRINITY_DN41578_c0_g1_i1:379-684(+)
MRCADWSQDIHIDAIPCDDRITLSCVKFRQEIVQKQIEREFIRCGFQLWGQQQNHGGDHQYQQALQQCESAFIHYSSLQSNHSIMETLPPAIVSLAVAWVT